MTPARWPAAIAVAHWLGAAAVIGVLALGFYMTLAELEAGPKFDLYQWHKTAGFLTLLLTLVRVAIRGIVAAPAPLATISTPMWFATNATHVGLYLLALGVGLSGWARVSSALIPIPIDLFGLAKLPAITPMNGELSDSLAWVHAWLAYALAAVVGLHIAAALKHHFVDRDATLARMLRAPR